MPGQNNNYIQGGFGGFTPCTYPVAGGPYSSAIQRALQSSITAIMNLYSIRRDTSSPDTNVRRLEYTKQLIELVLEDDGLGNITARMVPAHRPFRMPGGYIADVYEIEFICNNVTIHEVLIASNMSELAVL